MLDEITPVILTYNESPNIGRTMARLFWAREIVVVDSFSTDHTLAQIELCEQVRIFQRKFDTLAAQWNYALKQTGIETEWVLALDADYILSDEIIAELRDLEPSSCVGGYKAKFKYRVLGKTLHAALYPPKTVLYRMRQSIYFQDGHAHRVKVEGDTRFLRAEIMHDDRKSFSHWLQAQDRYMKLEAELITSKKWKELSLMNRVRKLRVVAPFMIIFYCLLVKRGILDGRAGWYYSFERMLAESILSLHLLQRGPDHN